MTPIALAIACLIAVTLSYALLCAASPFGRCRKCDGIGFKLRTDRKDRTRRGRECRRCHGTGLRLRIGRRIHNSGARAAAHAQRAHYDATH